MHLQQVLPQPLQDHNQWLVASNKIPVIPGSNIAIEGDRAPYAIPFPEACYYLDAGIHHQAGALHTKESRLISVDMDNVIVDDQPIPEVVPFLEKMKARGAYIETSFSGAGIRIPTWRQDDTPLEWSKKIVELTDRKEKERPKIELYNNNQCLLYTGNVIHPGNQLPGFEETYALLLQLYPPPPEPERPAYKFQSHFSLGNGDWQRRKIESALPYIDPDCTRQEWIWVGQALHDHFHGSSEGLAIWDQWSAGGAKYCETKGDDPEKKWKGFKEGKGVSLGTLYDLAKKNGWVKPEPVRELAPPAGESSPPTKPASQDSPDMKTQEDSMLSVIQDSSLPSVTPDESASFPIQVYQGQELDSLPQPEFLIDGVLPADSYGQLYGASGAGKSFVALDMAYHVGTGTDWCGHPVNQGWVLYLCGEGVRGMAARRQAWLKLHPETSDQENVLFSAAMPDFGSMLVMQQMVLACQAMCDQLNQPLQLVVIDTFARAMPGNENSAEDVGRFIRAIDYFRSYFNCCMLQVHHVGHLDKKRGRGSSALYAAFDFEFMIERLIPDMPTISLINTKTKDYEPPNDFSIKLEPVGDSLGIKNVVEIDRKELDKMPEMESNGIRLNDKQSKAWVVLKKLYAQHKQNKEGNKKAIARVRISDFCKALKSQGICERANGYRFVNDFKRENLIIRENKYIRLKKLDEESENTPPGNRGL